MEHDQNGNPVEPTVPSIVDKLDPIQHMQKRRAVFEALLRADPREVSDGTLGDMEHRMYIDALEYVEHFSEDAFCRIMAYHALGRRE